MTKTKSTAITTQRGGLFDILNKAREAYRHIGAKLGTLQEADLKALWDYREEIGNLDWMLAADIVAILVERHGKDENELEYIAKFLETSVRRVRELAQVHRDILSKAPELRDTNIRKSFYLIALRSKNPVEALKAAHDNNYDIKTFREFVATGTVAKKTFIMEMYSMEKMKTPPPGKQETYMTLSSHAKIVADGAGNKFLELQIADLPV